MLDLFGIHDTRLEPGGSRFLQTVGPHYTPVTTALVNPRKISRPSEHQLARDSAGLREGTSRHWFDGNWDRVGKVKLKTPERNAPSLRCADELIVDRACRAAIYVSRPGFLDGRAAVLIAIILQCVHPLFA